MHAHALPSEPCNVRARAHVISIYIIAAAATSALLRYGACAYSSCLFEAARAIRRCAMRCADAGQWWTATNTRAIKCSSKPLPTLLVRTFMCSCSIFSVRLNCMASTETYASVCLSVQHANDSVSSVNALVANACLTCDHLYNVHALYSGYDA